LVSFVLFIGSGLFVERKHTMGIALPRYETRPDGRQLVVPGIIEAPKGQPHYLKSLGMLPTREAAAGLGVSDATLRRWAHRGIMRVWKTPYDSRWFFESAELRELDPRKGGRR
jgi:excisionase family DNA binding protein